jgi:ABC-type transport system involved in cytochrome c biogenesis permease component
MAPRLCDSLRYAIYYIERAYTRAFSCLTRRTVSIVLPRKQPGLLIAVIVPVFLSTLIVVARSMRKVKRRPKYISKAGALAAESLLIASVVCIFSVVGA